MYSTKSTSTWVSQTFNQDVGDTNWNAYQIALTGAAKKYSIYTAGTTSSTLSTYDGMDIAYGATLLLSTNGTTLVSGPAGTITTTAPLFPTPSKITAQSVVSPTYMTTAPSYGQPMFMKPDGTKYWYVSSTGSTLREVNLTTAWDMSTAADSAKTIGGFGVYGFCFSPDGRILFSCDGTYVYVRYLATAWDITTAGASSYWTLPGGGTTYCRCMRISPDGLNLFIMSNSGVSTTYNTISQYQLNLPFQVATWNGTTATSVSQTFANSSGGAIGFELSPNGKTLVVGYHDGSNHNIKAFTLTTPWNVSSSNQGQIGSTFQPTNADFTSASTTGGMVLDPTGTKLIYFGGSKGFSTYTVDVNTKYNVNLISFSLGAAPTIAYAQPPRVFADMEATAPQVSLMPVEQDWISSTTTGAVFGANGTGLLATGDNLQLNYTTNVPLTSVTVGSTGGLAASAISSKIQYTGKYLTLPFNNYFMRFKPDGSTVYFSDLTNLYTYSLSVPWDITTAVQTGKIVIQGEIITGYSNIAGFDFNSTGTKLFIHMFVDSNTRLIEFNLSSPWVLGSLVATGRTMQTWTAANFSTYGGRFNETGTQFYFGATYSSNKYIRAWQLSTPYDIGTVTTSVDYNSNYYYGTCPPILEPGGQYLLTGQNTTGEQVLTTPNNFFNGLSQSSDVINNTGMIINFPGPGSTYVAYANEFSPDGMRMYTSFSNYHFNWVYQHRVRTKPLTQYTVAFAAQGAAPTSVSIPDRSTELTVTPSLSGGNMVLTTPQTSKNGRALAVKVVSNSAFTTVTDMTLNVWKV